MDFLEENEEKREKKELTLHVTFQKCVEIII
jgi:hypothetical protein